jgi:hypothetical protein
MLFTIADIKKTIKNFSTSRSFLNVKNILNATAALYSADLRNTFPFGIRFYELKHRNSRKNFRASRDVSREFSAESLTRKRTAKCAKNPTKAHVLIHENAFLKKSGFFKPDGVFGSVKRTPQINIRK